ncbi:Helix-turn-helix domain [Chryseobacterium taklimakanense]|uniref:Helix-turn-helix domain n=1 Tax=Chryseobacterium taklimakanense TaxID=536441 RepID=A0A239X8H6_9FLAO|nr:helix-turn-helix domain-containing protein [Chryseobacterium taklimakanense]SNV42987.1 Helix-turn-helix domain [Chryseobacterium taklimakanense]
MQTLNITVPQENINQIAENVETRLFDRLTKFLTDNAPKRYLSADEVCDRFGITKPTLHDWRRRGILRSYKLGSRVYYRFDEIENAMIIND